MWAGSRYPDTRISPEIFYLAETRGGYPPQIKSFGTLRFERGRHWDGSAS